RSGRPGRACCNSDACRARLQAPGFTPHFSDGDPFGSPSGRSERHHHLSSHVPRRTGESPSVGGSTVKDPGHPPTATADTVWPDASLPGSPVRVTRTCRLASSVAGTLLSSSGHDAANVYCSDCWCSAPGRDRIGREARSPWISRTHRTPEARLVSHLLGGSQDNRREASPVATHVRHRHSRGT